MATNSITGQNQVFPIYNENGTPFHDLVLRKGVVDSIVMSLGDKITGDVFYKDNTLQVTMKEYVVYNGIHYSLVNPPTIVREGMVSDNSDLKGMTKYSFEFYHPMYMLGNFPFTDVAVQPSQEKYLSQNKTFSWIGYLADYVDKINKNLDGTQWIVVIGSSVQQEELTKLSDVLSFDNVTIADALKTGYETWKVPYVVDVVASDSPYYAQGKRFMVQYGLPTTEIVDGGGNPFVFHYGQGVGLKNNSRTPRNNKIVTRIAGYGSENNIPYGYPQIVWYGNSDWDYTINNNPNNPLSYPIYKGIVGGRYVKLIKHPFTRNHLMPSIYSQTVFNKVSPYVSGGGANPNYNPSIEIKDYYDADNTYDNPIKQGEQSYEIHQFEDIKPELTHEYKLQAVVPYDEHAASKNFVTKESFLGSVLNRATSTEIALERTQMLALYNSINNNTAYNSSGSDDSYEYSCTTTSNSGYFTVTYKSSNFNFKSVILIAEQAPEWDDTMDEDGNYLQSYFQITLPQLTFDIYACAAITQEMKINMRSGACIGCTFPVQVDWDDYKNNFYDNDGNFTPTGSQRDYTKYPDSSQGTITILVQKENETFGALMPNIYQKPQAGDEFVVLGISLPLSYITNAEQRLDDAMKQYMRENNVYYYDYPLKFDEHFLATYPSVLNQMKNNVLVRFDYAGTEHALYIKQMAVRYGDKPLPQYDITLTDDVEIVLNQIGKTAEEVSNLRIILGEQERRSLSLEELDARYLRKDVDDDAAGLIRLIRGIQVGEQFVTGLLGEGGVFRRDDDGKTYLETDRLYVRMKAYFDTVEIRKYQHSSGNRIASNAGIKCSRVEYIDANGNVTTNIASAVRFRCYFKASEDDKTITNDFIVGDLAFCGETNINTGGLSQHRYWRAVVGKSSSIDANGEQYIDISVSDCETGSDVPIAQDDIIQLGNKTDTTRQGAIIEFVSGSDAPSYQIYQGINTYSLNNKNYVGMGYNSSTGRAYLNVYGDFRFGSASDDDSYIKYNAGSGQLDIKARINASSPVVDGNNTYNNMEDYIEAHSSDWTEEDINNLIHGVTDPIQQQVDGEIDTWFYEGTPTLNNAPASEWATETLKERHLGDLYYDMGTGATAGFAYRFVRTGNDGNYTYSWQYLEDTAITEALAMAANAQDTADHKRRIFALPVTIDGTTYNYPYPPYDVGDLWVNAKYPHDTGTTYNNEILKCKTAKSSGSFAISDWDKASKYTDDSYAHGFDFLTSNLARLSSTQIDGGLVLSSLIGLRDTSNNIQSGISGIVEATKKGSGIAAWYGGEQGDKEDQSHYTGITRWAKSLFRFDGSGYLADGNITWNAVGSVTIRNITTLYDSQNTDILNQLTTFSNMFRNSTWGSGQSTELRIQPQQHFDHINLTRGTGSVGGDSHYFDITDVSVLNYGEMKSRFITIDFFNRLFQAYSNADHADAHKILPNDVQTTVNNLKILVGTWTEQYISALGLSSSGGGGGSSTLEGLNDVEYVGTPTTGQILKYNEATHKWYNGTDEGITTVAWSNVTGKPTTLIGYGITDAKIEGGVITLGNNSITPLTSHQTIYALSVYGGTTKVLDFVSNSAAASLYIKAGGDITLTPNATNKEILLSYSHPTNGANKTISAANGKVLSAITVNSLGHVTSVSDKTLAAADIPNLSWNKITSDKPTTLAGYGIADALSNATTFFGQTVSNGVVSGNMTGVGNISFASTGKNIGSVMYFDTVNSRIGVGNSSPTRKLDVNGTFYASGNSAIGGTFSVSGATTLSSPLTVDTILHAADLDLFVGNAENEKNITFIEDVRGADLSEYSEGDEIESSWYISTGGDATFSSVTTGETLVVGSTLRVSSTTTLTGLLSANGGIVVPSSKTIKIGNGYLSWDNTNNAIRVSANADGTGAVNFYAIGGVSALGQSNSGSGGGGASSLKDLNDVSISNDKADKDILAYDEQRTHWVNVKKSTYLSGYATESWVSANFNKYSLPTASSSTLGGIKVGTTLEINASTGLLNQKSGIATAGTVGSNIDSSGNSITIPYVTVDTYGRVTGYGTHSHTVSNLPNTALMNNSVTVNGTNVSLGGSVTTSKWGTSRTLWGQSVDGSANVSGGLTGVTYIANADASASFMTFSETGFGDNGGIYVERMINFADDASFSSVVSFEEDVSMLSTFDVSGATTFGSTLSVSGATTMNGLLTVNSSSSNHIMLTRNGVGSIDLFVDSDGLNILQDVGSGSGFNNTLYVDGSAVFIDGVYGRDSLDGTVWSISNIGTATLASTTVGGTLSVSDNVTLANAKNLFFKDSSSNPISVLNMQDNNVLVVGAGMANASRSYNTYVRGGSVIMQSYYSTDWKNLATFANTGITTTVGMSVGGAVSASGNISSAGTLSCQGDISTSSGNIYTRSSNDAFIQIGAIRIVYDQNNNALKIVGSNGTSSANLYATGGVSALGQSSSGGGGGGGASSLADLNDVSLTSPASGDVLKYNGTHWVNVTLATLMTNYATTSWVNTNYATKTSLSGYMLRDVVDDTTYSQGIPTTSIINGDQLIDIVSLGNDGKIHVHYSKLALGDLASLDGLAFSDLTSHPTTLGNYGITDAYISNGTIYLGSNSITPLTSHQSLVNYVTLNSAQTITGAKTFNEGKWVLAANDNNEITSKLWDGTTLYNCADGAPANGASAIRNSIRFRFNSTYWVIGNARKNATTDSYGFVIGKQNAAGTHVLNCFRVDTDGVYVNDYKVWHENNDGADSGLDADKLDGQHGSYYAKASDLSNYLPLTGGTMLNTAKVVNMNADMLDGKHDGEVRALDMKQETKSNQEFTYRKSAKTIRVDSMRLDKVKGKTLAWNQQLANNFFTSNTIWFVASATLTIDTTNHTATLYSATATDNTDLKQRVIMMNNHKYYFSAKVTSRKNGIVSLTYYGGGRYPATRLGTISENETKTFKHIYTFVQGDGYNIMGFSIRGSGADYTVYGGISHFDLTLMFGAGNEPTIEQFEALFPSYHSYNAGELINNSTKAIESVGFNLWDEEWEEGAYRTWSNGLNGTKTDAAGYIRCKNLIPIIGGENIYIKSYNNYRICLGFYDENKQYLDIHHLVDSSTETAPQNAYYLSFYVDNSSSLSNYTRGGICINLSDSSKNGTYEPYKRTVTELNLDEIKVKSPNVWDEEWEAGSIDTGVEFDTNNSIRSKNYCVCVGGESYFLYCGGKTDSQYWMAIIFYDENKNYINDSYSTNSTVIAPSNAKYFRIKTNTGTYIYGNTYNHDICINVSDPAFNGRYFPHGTLTFNGLKSAGTVYDEISADGRKLIRRIGSVDLGTLTWYSNNLPTDPNGYRATFVPNILRAVCGRYETERVVSSTSWTNPNVLYYGHSNGNFAIVIPDNSYASAAAIKSAMLGVMLDYELATYETYELESPIPTSLPSGTTERRLPADTQDSVIAPFCADITYGTNNGDLAAAMMAYQRALGGAVGCATTPVYWDGSKFVACSDYSLASVAYATSAGSCTGNSATATALQNTRTIWGQSFDGSADVTGLFNSNNNVYLGAILDINRNGNTGEIKNITKAAMEIEAYSSFVALKIYHNDANSERNLVLAYTGGNVGIGTSSPSYKLHVDGTFYASGAISTAGTISSSATISSQAGLSTSGTLSASGNTTIGGTLGVTGATTLSSTLSAGATTLSSLTVNGATTFNNTINIGSYEQGANVWLNGGVQISRSISASEMEFGFIDGFHVCLLDETVDGSDYSELSTYADDNGYASLMFSYSSDNLFMGSNLYMTNLDGVWYNLYAQSISASGSLSVTGGTTLSSTLSVSGATTLSSTLSVANDITLANNKNFKVKNSGGTALSAMVMTNTNAFILGYDMIANNYVTYLRGSNVDVQVRNSSGTNTSVMTFSSGSVLVNNNYPISHPSNTDLFIGNSSNIKKVKLVEDMAGWEDDALTWELDVDGTAWFRNTTVKGNFTVKDSNNKNISQFTQNSIHAYVGFYSDSYVSALGQNTSSDIRMKDVVDYNAMPTVEQVANAPAIRYLWKGKRDLGLQVGSVAQYWQQVLPESVREDESGMLSMQYGVISLLASIATAKRVVDHEHRIIELERENEILRKEVEQLQKTA